MPGCPCWTGGAGIPGWPGIGCCAGTACWPGTICWPGITGPLLTGLARHHLLAGHDLLAGHLLARHRLLAGHHLLAGLAGHLLAGHLLAGYRLLAHWCRWGGLLPGVGCGRHAGGTLAGVGVAAPPLARGRQRLLRTWRLLGGRLAGHPGCGAGLRHARLRRHGTGGLGRLTLRRCGLAGRHSGLAGGSGRLGRRARRLLHARHGRRARRQVLGRSRPGVPGPPWLRRLLFGGRHADRARGVGRLLGTGLAVYGRLRRALVLGDDGRGVDLGRCGTRPGGQRLLMAKRADRPVTVGQGPARIGPDALALVIMERLRAHHQFHIRPQVCLTDLDDVVAFLPEGAGDCPVAVHRDVDQRDPETEILDVRDDLRQVLLGTDHERVLQGAVTRQGGQVAVDLALHALAAARPHPAQPQLHPGKVGERVMLG